MIKFFKIHQAIFKWLIWKKNYFYRLCGPFFCLLKLNMRPTWMERALKTTNEKLSCGTKSLKSRLFWYFLSMNKFEMMAACKTAISSKLFLPWWFSSSLWWSGQLYFTPYCIDMSNTSSYDLFCNCSLSWFYSMKALSQFNNFTSGILK